ncbi:MAG: transposase [Chloroflexi bacterium]|nr:transposase [Chloroflexota bacterium]
MQRIILVVSPDVEFIQQMHMQLEESGQYRVFEATNGHDALSSASNFFFDAAVLDAEICDIPFVPFTRDLVAMQPELKILILPLQNNPDHPVLAGLVANGFLNKPILGPDLLGALSELFHLTPKEPKFIVRKVEDLANLWIQHPDMGANRMEQILKITSARTGLLVLRGQVIAGSGMMDDFSVSNILNFLNRFWRKEENSELVRYLKMEGDPGDYLVFATKLISNVILVLIYTSTTSLQKMREEVNQIKKEFQQSYPDTGTLRKDIEEFEAKRNEPEEGEPQIAEPSPSFPGHSLTPIQELFQDFKEDPVSEQTQKNAGTEILDDLDALLAKLPPLDHELMDQDTLVAPLPDSELIPPAWFNENEGSEDATRFTGTSDSVSPPLDPEIKNEIQEIAELDDIVTPAEVEKEKEESLAPEFPDFNFILPWEDGELNLPEPPSVRDQDKGVFEATPDPFLESPLSEDIAFPDLDPENPAGDLRDTRFKYTCIMIPEKSDNFLVRDLSEQISSILPQLHLAKGWGLAGISIRPQYLLWMVSVPKNISPLQIIREIRNRTSIHIFSNFPEITGKDPSQNFWSAHYLAISGSQPPKINLINEFLKKTQKQDLDPL